MSKAKLLLIEDDKDLAEMYQLQLREYGYDVRIANNAEAAIGLLEDQPADLIILDILLPGQNGVSVLHELRTYADWKKIPALILSNVSAQELGASRTILENLGVFAYLEKSKTKPHTLAAIVKSALK